MNRPMPLILVVGFLGAGKTTFLRRLLPELEARGLEPRVMINDYINARVDAASLHQPHRKVTPINGNCICCDSLHELMEELQVVEPAPGRVVLVEANGTTEPGTLLEHLLVNPGLRKRYAPVLQVGVVDVARWQTRRWHNELERLQAETASHFLFTREEKAGRARFDQVRSDVEWINPRAAWVRVPAFAELLQQLGAGDSVPGGSNGDGTKETHPSHESAKPHHHGENAAHAHGRHDHEHALSHAFVGLALELPEEVPAKALQEWLASLPPEVLRVKGVVRFSEEKEQWYHFQRTDDLSGEAILRPMERSPSVSACAVLIGVGLEEAKLREGLKLHLGAETSGGVVL